MKIAASLPLSAFLVGLFILTITAAPTTGGAAPDAIRVDGADPLSGSELPGGWRFVRTPNPRGGSDAISIMHTADTSRSDLDLAGLIIRCNETGTEVAIVLLRPLPLRARPHVFLLDNLGHETRFEATIAAPGTAVLLPADGKFLVSGSWQTLSDLFIRISDDQTKVAGVVALTGLQAAFKVLAANCHMR